MKDQHELSSKSHQVWVEKPRYAYASAQEIHAGLLKFTKKTYIPDAQRKL